MYLLSDIKYIGKTRINSKSNKRKKKPKGLLIKKRAKKKRNCCVDHVTKTEKFIETLLVEGDTHTNEIRVIIFNKRSSVDYDDNLRKNHNSYERTKFRS